MNSKLKSLLLRLQTSNSCNLNIGQNGGLSLGKGV